MNDMNPAFVMPDVQSSHDTRQIPIQRVGVRGVRYPMSLQTPSGVQNTIGTYNLDVHLPADQKGTLAASKSTSRILSARRPRCRACSR